MNESVRRNLLRIVQEAQDAIDILMSEGEEAPEPTATDVSPKLAVVVGHTERSPGAHSKRLGVYEWNWNRLLASFMEREAEAAGLVLAVFYRDNGGITGAYDRARNWGADATMELHFNAARSPNAEGSEVIYVTPESKTFAKVIQAAQVAVLASRDRGAKTAAAASGGRGTASLTAIPGIPQIITEPFFGSNPQEAQKAQARKEDLARAYVLAAKEYLEAAN